MTSDGSVTIRNEADGQYVSADNYGTLPLIASRDSALGWEFYTLTRIGTTNTYTIKASANSELVALQSDTTLVANGGSTISTATTFTFTWL